MKVGQINYKKLSNKADYLQLDICGCNTKEAINKYNSFNKDVAIILHGDWTKKGCSENNLETRIDEYINITNELKKITKVIGFTLHPPTRHKMSLEKLKEYRDLLEEKTSVDVFIENRSSSRLNLSKANEIIDFSKENKMTIDIPQLYISCHYDCNLLYNTLSKINLNNIKEIHLANVQRQGKNTYVGRKLNDGVLDINKILTYFNDDSFYTLEILGGVSTFDKMFDILKNKKGR